MFVDVSAKQHLHIDDLLETILLQADVLELKANPDAAASGYVIEANLDKGRGSVATVLINRGTLHPGDVIVAGTSYGKVRALINPRGEHVDHASPADPVEVLGLNSVPTAGDEFRVFEDERDARRLAEERALRARLAKQESRSHMNLDDLFARIEEGNTTDLNLVVKADVMGSIEALRDAFSKMDQSEVKINIIHAAVGGITETDVTLAAASDAIIIGFNVKKSISACTVLSIKQLKISMLHVLVYFHLILLKKIPVLLRFAKPLRYLRLAPLLVAISLKVKFHVMIRYVSYVMVRLSLKELFIAYADLRMTLSPLLVVMNAVLALKAIKILRLEIPSRVIASLKKRGSNNHETRIF